MRAQGPVAAMALAVGAAVAFGFALVIHVLPEWLFLEPGGRVVAFVIAAAAAPPTIWFLQGVARLLRGEQRAVVLWGNVGAMAFDGLAIGFVPGLYGQTGTALAGAAAMMLFAFACNLVAAAVMVGLADRPSPKPAEIT